VLYCNLTAICLTASVFLSWRMMDWQFHRHFVPHSFQFMLDPFVRHQNYEVSTNRWVTSHCFCTFSAPDDINEEFRRPLRYFLLSEWYLTKSVPCLRRLVPASHRGTPYSFPSSPCFICSGQSGAGTGFTQSAAVSPVSAILPLDPPPYVTSITGSNSS